MHVPQEYETWHGGFYVNQGKLRFKMGADTAEDVNLITGTKKRNLGLRRLSSDDDGDSEDSETEKKGEKSPKKKAPEKVKEKSKVSEKVSKEKPTPKVAPQKTITTTTPKLDMKKPTSPGRSSQRSPRSPARLIMEKSAPTPPPVAPSTPDESDHLPGDTPPKLRELCGTLRQIAELQKALGLNYTDYIWHLFFEFFI